MWDVGDVGCSRCGMLGMWDVGDVGCWGCGMFGMWDVRDVGCSGCGMFEMWDVWDVGCGMWDVDLQNAGFICKRLKQYEPSCSEYICFKFTISKKKWICFSIYRPSSTKNIEKVFEKMNEVISKALCKYENLMVMLDFNIYSKSSNCDKDKLESFHDLYNLANLVHLETCFTKDSEPITDLILADKPLHFQKTHVIETALRDYYKMISTFFQSIFIKIIN